MSNTRTIIYNGKIINLSKCLKKGPEKLLSRTNFFKGM